MSSDLTKKKPKKMTGQYHKGHTKKFLMKEKYQHGIQFPYFVGNSKTLNCIHEESMKYREYVPQNAGSSSQRASYSSSRKTNVTATLREHSVFGTLEYIGDDAAPFQNQHLQHRDVSNYFPLISQVLESSVADDIRS